MSKAAWILHEQLRKRDNDTRTRDVEKADLLLDRLFLQQREFVLDPSRFKAALCPRRSGKSFAVLVYALNVALRRPGAKVLVLARVRRQVRGVFWQPLKQLCSEAELDVKYRNVMLEVEFANNSFIQFAGADTAEEIDKYRGQGYDLVVLDEAKSYSAALLQELLEEVIAPALTDRLGTLAMIGTPGCIPQGLFWAVTTMQTEYRAPGREAAERLRIRPWRDRKAWGRKKYSWSFHQWSAKDNIHCPWIWQDMLRIKDEREYADDHPVWLREYCGQWIPDHDSLVYAYLKAREQHEVATQLEGKGSWGLPEEHQWYLILGLDFGYTDASAFVVAAWSPTHRNLIAIHAERHSKLVVEEIADKIRQLERHFGGFSARIADVGGLGKGYIESLRRTYGIHCEAANKQDKCGFVKLLNSDLLTGRILVSEGGAWQLLDEWETLQWRDAEHKVEDPNCDNHCSDAFLYLYKYAHHHWSVDRIVEPVEGSREWWEEFKRKEREAAYAEAKARKEPWLTKLRSKMDRLPLKAWLHQQLK